MTNVAVIHYQDNEVNEIKNRLKSLIRQKSVLIGTFELASGGVSDVFFDMKNTTQDRDGMHLVAELLAARPELESVEYLGGLELGAVPVVMATCMKANKHAVIIRKARKERGTNQLIEGDVPAEKEVIVVDDVTTKGSSVMQAVKALREHGCIVDKAITVLDRLEGAKEKLKENGVELIPLFTRDELDVG